MINQQAVQLRRIIICNNCHKPMEAGGTWPLSQVVRDNKLIPIGDEVATSYYCRTQSCKVEFAARKSDGSVFKGLRCVKVIEPDLFVGPCTDSKYNWEISPR
jgi:hypothetical protein